MSGLLQSPFKSQSESQRNLEKNESSETKKRAQYFLK
jgi:hypothetical protein